MRTISHDIEDEEVDMKIKNFMGSRRVHVPEIDQPWVNLYREIVSDDTGF